MRGKEKKNSHLAQCGKTEVASTPQSQLSVLLFLCLTHSFFLSFFLLETVLLYTAEADTELAAILLPQFTPCWQALCPTPWPFWHPSCLISTELLLIPYMSYQQSERERREEDLATATEVSTSLLEKGPHIHRPLNSTHLLSRFIKVE